MKLKKIIKYTFIALILFFIGFLALRIFMTGDRATLDDIYPTEAAVASFEKDKDDAFITFKLPYDMSRDGYYTAYSPAYAKEGRELQITVRYNDSLPENYLIDSDPADYYFELRDSEGNTVSKARIVDEKERYFYNHFRLAFSDIDIDEDSELYLFLCCDECTYPADHTEGIIVVHPSFPAKELNLSKAEKEALSK